MLSTILSEKAFCNHHRNFFLFLHLKASFAFDCTFVRFEVVRSVENACVKDNYLLWIEPKASFIKVRGG